jgi:hypothetical protein
MRKSELEYLVSRYRWHIEQMQGHTFYVEDPDGFLRRWYPPKPIEPQESDT